MRLVAFFGIVAVIAVGCVAAFLSSNYSRSPFLTPAELTLQQPNQRLSPPVDDCSGLQRELALSAPATGSPRPKPAKSTNPLSTDEIAIYRAVLQHWTSNERTALNISSRTFPLDITARSSRISECNCLKGMQAEPLLSAFRSFHDLSPEILPNDTFRLVDPKKQLKVVRDNDPDRRMVTGKSVNDAVRDAFANGLFELSEIAFDKDHHYALVSYSFSCGSLCGNGGTFFFEKVGETWKKTDRVCGGWVS